MAIKTYTVHTCMGQCVKGTNLPFITDDELKEFNKIGYTGKNSKGDKTNYEDYLNSLGKGEVDVNQTKFDNGEFCETFVITHVPLKPNYEPNVVFVADSYKMPHFQREDDIVEKTFELAGIETKKIWYIPLTDLNGIPNGRVYEVVEGSGMHKMMLKRNFKFAE